MNTIIQHPIDNSYIGISTNKFKEASQFYIEHFGYSLIHEDQSFASVMSPNGKRCLGFTATSELESSTGSKKGIHLSFLVPSAQEAFNHFRAAGISISRDIQEGNWGAPHFIITDPSGIDLYISEKAIQS